MKKIVYPAIFAPNGDGSYTVSFPDLPGCITFGKDLADAIYMAEDAACCWLLDEFEEEKPMPKPSAPAKLKIKKGEFMSLMALNMEEFAAKYSTKSVRKNTTIPAFLNTFGEKNHINYSKLLTNALMDLYLAK